MLQSPRLVDWLQFGVFAALAFGAAFWIARECTKSTRRKDHIMAAGLLGFSCWWARQMPLSLSDLQAPAWRDIVLSAPSHTAFYFMMVLWLGMVLLGVHRAKWWVPVLLAPFAVPTWRSQAGLPPIPSFAQYGFDLAVCLGFYCAGRIITALREKDASFSAASLRGRILGFMLDDMRSIYRFASRHWFVVALLMLITLLPMSGHVGAEFGIYNIFQPYLPYFCFFWTLIMGLLFIHHMIAESGERVLEEAWRAATNPRHQDSRPLTDAAGFEAAAARSWLAIVLNFLPLALIPVVWLYFFATPDVPALTLATVLLSLGAIAAAVGFLGVWFFVVTLLLVGPAFGQLTSFAELMQKQRSAIRYATRNIALGVGFGLVATIAFSVRSTNWGLDTHYLILFLLMSASTVYVVYLSVPYHARLLIVAGVALWWAPFTSGDNGYVLPGLRRLDHQSYYQRPVALAASYAQAPSLIDPVEALANWHASQRDVTLKPKLVIVAASGGGYRATFWSALVIDELRRQSQPSGRFPGLLANVRLMTGASGGMVAAAYHATHDSDRSATLVERIRHDVAGAAADQQRAAEDPGRPAAIDSLSSIAYQLVMKDLLLAPLPWPRTTDRGIALEMQWSSLGVTFASLRQAELEGRRPSLLLSPVIVETGQPILISNLNIVDASNHAQHFFKMFPESYGAFKVSTAVRANASFPYISPIAALPTTPLRHVGDAGYHDNFGISAATTYLTQPRVADWIKQNTSGIILIQIRAYPAEIQELDPRIEQACREPTAVAMLEASTRRSSQLTGPVRALLASRETGMRSGLEHQMEILENVYKGRSDEFVRTVVFENAAKSSLSWYLPISELECMRGQLASLRNQDAFDRLAGLWLNKADAIPDTSPPREPAALGIETGDIRRVEEGATLPENPAPAQPKSDTVDVRPKKSPPKKPEAPDWKREIFPQR